MTLDGRRLTKGPDEGNVSKLLDLLYVTDNTNLEFPTAESNDL